jgi:uncharacterized protein (TIGR00369 family)
MTPKIPTEGLRELNNFIDDRNCFACGQDNPAGLRMRFHTDGQYVWVHHRLAPQHCGWETIAHGGIICALLDETMSWTAHHLLLRMILTKALNVTFHRPVQIGQDIQIKGEVIAVPKDSEARLQATLYDAQNKVCAQGQGTFALLTPKIARRLAVIDNRIIDAFERFVDGR